MIDNVTLGYFSFLIAIISLLLKEYGLVMIACTLIIIARLNDILQTDEKNMEKWKMGLFKKSEKEKSKEEKIEEFKHKCNFLQNDGSCALCQTDHLSDIPCSFENCIFMKMFNHIH